ncbi:lipid A biosynthesis lauroyl acyltransferase [Aureimonas jatrophae]|jgi:Kdo2-lipid IVA lauroyltransferase/acyltransferase|uniref:KDO2-lipid IV(A) lauroyltransferase n=1 Tax=Aureimonas jatrophae TaxID=1166073 RepID=A0A1H0GD67_9HYPH|nr:lipid A biosynthesis lauroyl acyltransferase [Aureimonas jatrophae]MBB3949516.1 KDO2-lipid IV(A) lauroyltransferase [Aureimonas jatrophae]SDO04804.1 KDO2-lipid IV(A) lauroyltransferase [Aureimonas jatrophae]
MNQRLARAWKLQKKARNYLVAQVLFAILALLRRFPAERGLALADRLARWIGPWTPRHRLAVANLRAAYPDRSDAWIQATAVSNWGQMGRVAAEYVFLDALFDFDPSQPAGTGRIEVEGIEIFEALRDSTRPTIFFTAHSGCFELLPICAATFGLEVTALFRQPNNRYIAREVQRTRRTNSGKLVPSKAGAAWALAGVLQRGGHVGMLVDQKFAKGRLGTFFGRPCRTNPLLAKLARQFDCDVHPARSIRLPDGRYRLELKPKLELPRDPSGDIDIDATCQLLNDVVEAWVREHPEQWMWFHRRWQIDPPARAVN